MSHTERTDAELVAAFHAGDRTVFADIYDRHADAVYSHFAGSGFTRGEAADATCDALLEAATRLEDEVPEDLGLWILALAQGESDPAPPDETLTPPAALRPRVLTRVENAARRRRLGLADLRLGLEDLNPDLVRIGVFAVVTVALGLIGLAVSAQFEPLDRPDSTLPATTLPAVDPTTTTSVQVTTTSGDDQPTTTSVEAAPAEIEVSTDSVDFGDEGVVTEFDLVNSGDEAATWSLSSSIPAIAVSDEEGELAGGETETIELNIDRTDIEEGDLSETITITWSGGEIEIEVSAVHEDDPTIHNPNASPAEVSVGGECGPGETTISARVRDTSPIELVVVRWSPDGAATTETEMSAIGDDLYQAEIGPFSSERTVEARVVGFDERGNAGGATATFSVVACP